MKYFITYRAVFIWMCLCVSACQLKNTEYETSSDDLQIGISFDTCVLVSIHNIQAYSDTISYIFPNSLLGTYHEINAKINDVIAIDTDGNNLPIKMLPNGFVVYNAKGISSLHYKCPTSDYTTRNVLSSGLTILPNLIVLNNNVMIGHFSGISKSGVSLTVTKDKNLSVISNKLVQHISDTVDLFHYSDIDELIHFPTVYSGNASTETFYIDSTCITIGIHSPTNVVAVEDIKKSITPTIRAVLSELDFLKIDKYNVTLIFNEYISNKLGELAALEHPTSTVLLYSSEPFLKTEQDSIEFYQQLQTIIAHELLHLFTPLNFRDPFDDNFVGEELAMSQHLWLYEGFVDYLSFKTLLDYNIIDFNYFFSVLNKKKHEYERYEKIGYKYSLATHSKNIYNNWDLYSFYNRASILCFLMDIETISLSKGEHNLFSVLKTAHANNNAFFDKDSLFVMIDDIVPGLKQFTDSYIVGDEYPDVSRYLSKAGLRYSKVNKKSGFYFPIKIANDNMSTDIAKVTFTMNTPPFYKGDTVRVLSINGEKISQYVLSGLYKKYFDYNASAEVEYYQDGFLKQSSLKAVEAINPQVPYFPHISIDETKSNTQQRVFDQLFKKKSL